MQVSRLMNKKVTFLRLIHKTIWKLWTSARIYTFFKVAVRTTIRTFFIRFRCLIICGPWWQHTIATFHKQTSQSTAGRAYWFRQWSLMIYRPWTYRRICTFSKSTMGTTTRAFWWCSQSCQWSTIFITNNIFWTCSGVNRRKSGF